jgi:hypothetical protein
MHQVCLGVMKRLLVCWTAGSKKVRLSHTQKVEVNSRINAFRAVVTEDFSRKPRSLAELAHWKATEFRFFLLYSGYLVLHKIAREEVVEHFLCLHVAMRILISDELVANLDHRRLAQQLLIDFVKNSHVLYGQEFLVYNVHSLIHLCDEAKEFGALDHSGAFIFENFMQELKKSVRCAKNPILQIAHRLEEKRMFGSGAVHEHKLSCTLGDMSCRPPNNSAILHDGRCIQVVSSDNDKEHIACMIFGRSEPLYALPCDSRNLGIHKVRLQTGIMKNLPRSTTVQKAMCYAEHECSELIFIQLLHYI